MNYLILFIVIGPTILYLIWSMIELFLKFRKADKFEDKKVTFHISNTKN